MHVISNSCLLFRQKGSISNLSITPTFICFQRKASFRKINLRASQRSKPSTHILYNCLNTYCIWLHFGGSGETVKQTTRNNRILVNAIISTDLFTIWKRSLYKVNFIKNAFFLLPLRYCDTEVNIEVRF